MAAEILSALAVLNLAAAAAILCVLLLRRPVRRAFGARVAYGLWLLVPLAAAATLLPARRIVQTVTQASPPPPIPYEAIAASAVQAQPLVTLPALMSIALLVWLTGTMLGLGLLLMRQARSVKQLGELIPSESRDVWRAAHPAVGPAVIGLIAPRIVLPADFDTRFDADERAVVLAHEVHHLAAHDARLNALASLIQCLCWFNPMVHVAVRRFRTDQELACDETVLARFPDRRRTYADALLKTQLSAAPLPLGCYWPARTASPLRERIAMLKQALPGRRRRLAGAGLILTLAASTAAAAWAAQPAQRVFVLAPAKPVRLADLAPGAAPGPATPPMLIHAASSAAAPAIQPPAQPEAPVPAAPAPRPWSFRIDIDPALAAGASGRKLEFSPRYVFDNFDFNFDPGAFADFAAWGQDTLTDAERERIVAQARAAAEQAKAAAAQARANGDLARVQADVIRRQAQTAARVAARAHALKGQSFAFRNSPEREKAMAELAELMKPSPAEIERNRRIAELSKPSPEEQERLRKLRELRAQRTPEEVERRRLLNEKMRELNMVAPGALVLPIPPAPPRPAAAPAPGRFRQAPPPPPAPPPAPPVPAPPAPPAPPPPPPAPPAPPPPPL